MPKVFDVVEYPNEMKNELVHRLPEVGAGHFKLGSQVIVREGQNAVLFRDGKSLAVFGPGRHTISTANVPVLTDLIAKGLFGGTSPFPAEVYFVSMREFPQIGWGTQSPIAMQTPGQGFGWLLLGARGTFGLQVKDAETFVTRFVGANGIFRMSDIKDRLNFVITQALTDLISEVNPGSLMKLQSLFDEIQAGVRAKVQDAFNTLGMELKSLTIGAITPLETSAEKLRDMGLLTPQVYAQLQAADALREAASQTGGGGLTGAGLGLGAGAGMGAMMAQLMGQIMGGGAQQGGAGGAAPAGGAAEAAGEMDKAKIQKLLDALDERFAMGEISEETYKELRAKWEARLKEE